MNIKERVKQYEPLLLQRLEKLVAINSEYGTPSQDAPFGQGPKQALLTALEMLEEDGIKTTNLDHYIGYGEIGSGQQVIGVIGHLDIVPAKKEDGWTHDPFKMTNENGVLFGRGVSDDKGAVVASMIALKIIQDMQVPLTKRIRLIMGTNEETGSKCLEYYVKKEGHVDYGFTPDGDFPCVHGEKGMVGANYLSKTTNILAIDGGSARNIVCRQVRIEVLKNTFSKKTLEDYFLDHNIRYELNEKEDRIELVVYGVAAHASLPHLGVNALSYLMVGLKEAGFQDPFVEYYVNHFGLTTNGQLLGIQFADEYGELTLNNGVIHMEDGVIKGSIDIRFPVTMNSSKITKPLLENGEDEGGKIEVLYTTEPLFFPTDSPLVSSLMEAYQEVTGDTQSQPLTIGGGTYAKGIHNTIAFGCAFLGKDYHIHDVDETVDVDELLLQVEIYVNGLLKLLAL